MIKLATYRDQGAIGAILDEMEKAIIELKSVIAPLTHLQLVQIVDPLTEDKDCQSIQTILTHVVAAGYNYVVYCRKAQGEVIEKLDKIKLETTQDYIEVLDNMFMFNIRFFVDFPAVKLNENDNSKRFVVPWGPSYDVEGLMEHAIVHILRHRRQIERFIDEMQIKSLSKI